MLRRSRQVAGDDDGISQEVPPLSELMVVSCANGMATNLRLARRSESVLSDQTAAAPAIISAS